MLSASLPPSDSHRNEICATVEIVDHFLIAQLLKWHSRGNTESVLERTNELVGIAFQHFHRRGYAKRDLEGFIVIASVDHSVLWDRESE
jgi:hypothetical protein